MTSMRNLARVAMASKVLADAAREEGMAAREALNAAMAEGGVERVRVTDDGGEDYGTVVLAPGRKAAHVVDDGAFVAWVALRYPDQMVMTVRPSFRERVLASATRLGDPVDPQTGEVIPGLEIRHGDPYLVTKPSTDAKDRMKTALVAHNLLALGSSAAAEFPQSEPLLRPEWGAA